MNNKKTSSWNLGVKGYIVVFWRSSHVMCIPH